jgi:DNA polymerase-3 subunit alpha
MKRVKELGMNSVAMTDHGNMFGAINFYLKAKDAGITPIIGCEVYVAPGDRRDHNQVHGQDIANHLVLLSENVEGYFNLVRLVSSGFTEGFYYKPRIDLEILKEHHKGLIALSACLQGRVPKRLMNDDFKGAKQEAIQMAQIMGDGNFFIELQDAGIPEQKKVNQGLIEIADELGLGMVATNDCHYLNKEDHEAHDALLCIQTGKFLSDKNRMRLSDQLYFKSPEEMDLLFGHVDGAMQNTVDLARRCEFEMPLNKLRFPQYPLQGRTAEEVVREKARKGLDERYKTMELMGREYDREVYEKRLAYELDVIEKMGFPGYFLVVADFINWSKDHDIPVGPGRGSAAGSLVAYAMRITDLDPIRYKLIFERFLNIERKSMPDIDVDFCMDRRGEVIEYVTEKYGDDSVAQIITFGSMQARAVLRDVGRVMELPYAEVDQIAKLVPSLPGINLTKALEAEPRLKDRYEKDPKVKKLLEIGMALEGLPRHASTHAAGVVIGDVPLNHVVPLYKGSKEEIVTQYDMKCVEKAGLIKFDFLGLRTLTVINLAVQMIKQGKNPDFDINTVPRDDQASYELLSSGETTGVFQLESSGMKELLVKMKPSTFEDIIALVALYRPGPLESGMVDDFVARKHGKKKVSYPLPQLEDALKETYGVIVYQEQVQEIARVLAGYSLGEGDILRRAMGKKVPEVMEEQRERFMKGAQENNIDPGKAAEIFDLMAKFAGYGFNKSHSAAYGLIAYQTAYLKAHYPHEFMASLLTSEVNNTEAVMRHIAECRDNGIKVLPPDINSSERIFTVEEDAIRFGMSAIKNVGAGAVESILAARREGGEYKDIFDFCERVDLRKVNKKVLESLIKCGAFDSTGAYRSQLMGVMEEALDYGQKMGRDRLGGQTNMFAAFTEAKPERQKKDLPQVAPWSEPDQLAYEKEALGLYISGHPLNRFKQDIRRFTTQDTQKLAEASDGCDVKLAGLPTEIKEKVTKKGDRMAFVRLEDLKGSLELIVFPNCFAECSECLATEEPLFVKGTLDRDERGVKIKATKIIPLEQAAQGVTTRIKLYVNADNCTREHLVSLRQTLEKNPGDCRVSLYLNVPGKGEAVLALPNRYRIKPDASLLEEINGLFGCKVTEPVISYPESS